MKKMLEYVAPDHDIKRQQAVPACLHGQAACQQHPQQPMLFSMMSNVFRTGEQQRASWPTSLVQLRLLRCHEVQIVDGGCLCLSLSGFSPPPVYVLRILLLHAAITFCTRMTAHSIGRYRVREGRSAKHAIRDHCIGFYST